MFLYSESGELLRILGQRIMTARVAGGNTQSVFAYRIGVSVPTLREVCEAARVFRRFVRVADPRRGVVHPSTG